ncbi:MAG: hypothetical protein R6X02_32235 [Enhygromyxa sp.]
MDDDDRREPDDPSPSEKRQRLYDELFRKFGDLIDGGVDIDDLRRALQGSFMLTASPEQRSGWDDLRLEIDAYLRARRDGEAAVTTPEGFVASPDLSKSRDDDEADG